MSENIVVNGDFKNGLDAWKVNFPELVEVIAEDGMTFARDHIGNLLLQQTVNNVVPGKKYTASCIARVPGFHRNSVWFGCHDSQNMQSVGVILSEDFREYAVELTPQNDSLVVYLLIELEGPDNFYVDITNISLVEESGDN